jgi:hypothetical protein
VNAAYNAARDAVGDRCGAVGQCTPDREPCAGPIFLGCIDTSDMIAAELRKKGLCASGSWGGGPEIAILDSDGWWKQYHPCATETGCYTGNPYKFAWWYTGQNPTPPAPPASSGCTGVQPIPIDHWNVNPDHNKGPNKTIVDSTPMIHNAAYCAQTGWTDGRIDCPVRQETDPQRAACEALVATPNWVAIPPGGRVSPENPNQLWVPRGQSGLAKVCAVQTPTACGQGQVTP